MRGIAIDYDRVLSQGSPGDQEALASHLSEQLPPLWRRTYRRMAQSPTNILRFADREIHVLFDHASALVARGVIPADRAVEDRIVVAFGRSYPFSSGRTAGSMQRRVGPAARTFGIATDRGLPMAHPLGSRSDLALFPLRRGFQQKWSMEGRVFRAMEKYCAEHPGTFCFCRPIYDTKTWWPCSVEYGLLLHDGRLWVRCFDNT